MVSPMFMLVVSDLRLLSYVPIDMNIIYINLKMNIRVI